MSLDELGMAGSERTLTLHAERIELVRRVVATARVTASRTTTTRDEAVDETLAAEEFVVERVPVGQVVDAIPPTRQEGDTTVFPIVEEVLVVERRLVLKEELRIRRVRTTRQHVETVSLRSQDAAVSRTEIEDPARRVTAMADQHPPESLAPNSHRQGTYPMNGETIVAVYDTPAHAALAVADLKEAGIPEDAISVHASDVVGSSTATAPVREEGFWASIFGGDAERDTAVYDRSLASGSTVVTVKGSDAYSAKVADILESHKPIDIDERAAGYGLTETTTTRQPLATPVETGTAAAGHAVAGTEGGTIQLSEERLSVGKRLVNRGSTRIRRFVVETPVEESVTLREERVTLERRPVTDGKPVMNADFTDKTIEMTETSEEVVVAKQAFVTEEIALKKEVADRVETVRDTVRKEDVEIVQVPGEAVTSTTTTTPVTPLIPRKV